MSFIIGFVIILAIAYVIDENRRRTKEIELARQMAEDINQQANHIRTSSFEEGEIIDAEISIDKTK